MTSTSTTRLILIAIFGLLMTARPSLASDGTPLPTEKSEVTLPAETDEQVADVVPAEDQAEDQDHAGPALASDEIDRAETPDDQAASASPIKMDRAGWPTIVLTPTDGSVTHNPAYMGNPPMGDDIVTPLHAPDPVWQIQEALAGAEAGNLNSENLLAMGTQPFIGLAQFFLIPARAVFENPLSDVTSP